jgi:hypothetical protein
MLGEKKSVFAYRMPLWLACLVSGLSCMLGAEITRRLLEQRRSEIEDQAWYSAMRKVDEKCRRPTRSRILNIPDGTSLQADRVDQFVISHLQSATFTKVVLREFCDQKDANTVLDETH